MKPIYLMMALLVLGAACSSKSKGSMATEVPPTDSLEIASVEFSDGSDDSQVVIDANREPKYNVFKLTEPDRVVIDLIDARLSENVPTTIPGDGNIQEIRVSSLEDSLSALVRLEVILNTSANYLAALEGNRLVVRILKDGTEEKSEPGSETLPSEPGIVLPVPQEEMPMAEVPEPMPMESTEATPTEEAPAEPEMKAEAPMPMPEAETSMPEATADMAPKSDVPMASESPMTETPMAMPVPVPVPVPLEPSKQTAEEAPMPMPQPEQKVAEPVIPPGVQTQDIPSSGLTVGTSTLTELDSKVYTGRRVSLEFQDAEVVDILRLIAEVSKLNIITGDDVKGRLTLKLIDVPWDQALDIILTTLGMDKVQHGNILRVAPAEKLKKEREIALANDKAAKQLEPLRLKLINVNYATGGEMAARIKNMLSERGTVDVDERTNTLIVKDIREHLSRIENLIKVLDTQTPQVRIESRIVEATDNFSRGIGIQWGPTLTLDETTRTTSAQFPYTINAGGGSAVSLSPFAVDFLPNATNAAGTFGLRLGSVSDIFNLDLRLQYSETEGQARVVSRPSVTVLDNKTARIIQGTKIPFLSSSSDGANVTFQEAGIEISVTPQITNDGSVLMKVNTKSNSPGDAGVGGNPSINIREATTEMLVKSGRTAVLGGVFKTTEGKTVSGVPGLKDIPILGWLFKSNVRNSLREETLVFITPYVLSDQRHAITTPSSSSQLEP